MGFYGNLMHKYKKNEITFQKGTICSAIIYLFNYIQVFNLNSKIINITEFLNFFFIFIRICHKMMILPRIPKVILKKFRYAKFVSLQIADQKPILEGANQSTQIQNNKSKIDTRKFNL